MFLEASRNTFNDTAYKIVRRSEGFKEYEG